jgi:hypothetical protein
VAKECYEPLSWSVAEWPLIVAVASIGNQISIARSEEPEPMAAFDIGDTVVAGYTCQYRGYDGEVSAWLEATVPAACDRRTS